jgi:hypothetical protein
MKNKRQVFVLATLFPLTLGILLATNPNFGQLELAKAIDNNYVLTLNESNKPTLNDGTGTLTINNFASLVYTHASEYEGGHVSLSVDGTISKTEASNTLKNIVVVYEGNIQLDTGYELNDVTYRYDDLVSGQAHAIQGNYFTLTALEDTDITSIELTYDCIEEEVEGEHKYNVTYSYNETHHWREHKEEYYIDNDDIEY